MTTPIPDLLAAVSSIDTTGEPFAFCVEGDRIVGTWDIVRATSLYATALEHVDKDYRITVELDAEKGTYDVTERSSSTTGRADGDGVSGGKEVFVGRQTKKEFSFTLGGVNKTEDGVSLDPVVYAFDTARIKEPLFAFLDQHGWERRKSLLGRLFSR